MKKILVSLVTLSLIAFNVSISWGTSYGVGARAIGMGGAYTAVADDVYAPYWNPAGIVQTPHFGLTFGAGFQGDLEKLSNMQDALSNNQMPAREDMNQSYFLNGYLGLITRYFALSGYGDFQLNTVMDDTQNVGVGTNLTGEGYGVLTFAFIVGESLAIGVNLKSVAAAYGEAVLPTFPDTALVNGTPEQQNQFLYDVQHYTAHTAYNTGTGTACDIGTLLLLTPEVTLGFTAHNLFTQIDPDEGNYTPYTLSYNGDSSNPQVTLVEGTPTNYTHSLEIPKTYTLGMAYRPFDTTTLAIDVESITNTSNDQIRIHAGLEQTALWDFFALRVGYFTNKGASASYTAGVGFKLWGLATNAACIKNSDGYFYTLTGDLYF